MKRVGKRCKSEGIISLSLSLSLTHTHTQGCFLGKICQSCNVKLTQSTLQIFAHHFSGFDAKFLLQSLDSPNARRRIKSVKLFSKSAEAIIMLEIQFYCLCCFPEDVLSTCPPYATLSEKKEVLDAEYKTEFDNMIEVIYKEIDYHERNKIHDYDEGIEEEEIDGVSPIDNSKRWPMEDEFSSMDDDNDETSEEEDPEIDPVQYAEGYDDAFDADEAIRELQTRVDSFNQSRRRQPVEIEELVSRRQKISCPHAAAAPLKRIIFKDSNLLVRSSLHKASSAITNGRLQEKFCDANPMPADFVQGEYGPPLNLESRRCNCKSCSKKFHLPSQAPELLRFGKLCLPAGSEPITPILHKMDHFPYQVLDLEFDELMSSKTFPEQKLFTNSLQDNAPISASDYAKFQQFCYSIGIKNAPDLLIWYSWSDVQCLSLVMTLSTLFLYEQFGLNLLNFGSIRYVYLCQVIWNLIQYNSFLSLSLSLFLSLSLSLQPIQLRVVAQGMH